MRHSNAENPPSTSDHQPRDIGLVGVMRSVQRRRWLFISTLVSVLIAGTAFAIVQPSTYTYTSIYQLASIGSADKPLQAPHAALATIGYLLLPAELSRYQKDSGTNLPSFRITASNPESTLFIVLRSRGTVSQQSAIRAVHQGILEQLETVDRQLISKEKTKLTAVLNSQQSELDALKGVPENGIPIASVLQRKSNAQRRLSSLTDGRIITLASRSARPMGPARRLIIVTSFILGAILGLLAVMLAEFLATVARAG